MYVVSPTQRDPVVRCIELRLTLNNGHFKKIMLLQGLDPCTTSSLPKIIRLLGHAVIIVADV
jgi:hypothetical protein